MLNIGDYVRHQTTGQLGQIVAYGHQIQDGTYLPTVRVQLIEGRGARTTFLEDLSSTWIKLGQLSSSQLLQTSSLEAAT